MQIIRKKMQLQKEQSLYLLIQGKHLLKQDTMVSTLFDKYRDADGFLYITYTAENVHGFGQWRL